MLSRAKHHSKKKKKGKKYKRQSLSGQLARDEHHQKLWAMHRVVEPKQSKGSDNRDLVKSRITTRLRSGR
jgi:hypothetical protein